MAIVLRNSGPQSDLQKRIAAELREKQKASSLVPDDLAPLKSDRDELDPADSAYLKNTKQTTSLAWAWALIAGLAVVAITVIIMVLN